LILIAPLRLGGGHEGRSGDADQWLTVKALADPGLKARYAELGASPMPTSPAEMKAFRAAEEARLLPIMKAAGIKPG